MVNLSDRIAILARQPNPVFHTKDLARLWGITNSNTVYTLLKRYTHRKLLFRIYKGLYSLLPIEKIDPLLLGSKALHGYSYVSTETILVKEGIITQIIYSYTFVSNSSRSFKIGSYSFRSRQLKDQFLYNPVGIIEDNGILKATTERAIVDLLYFNPKAYLDGASFVDFKKVKKIQQELGYPLTKITNATTTQRR